jgi:8-oxo-dGTP pyrophosphatase MutT (NUDIX family)
MDKRLSRVFNTRIYLANFLVFLGNQRTFPEIITLNAPIISLSLARITMLTLKDIERLISPLLKPDSTMVDSPKKCRTYPNLWKTAAVLIIIHCKYRIPHLLLTKRSSNLKSHTGEISFPGGHYCPAQDSNLLDTALRETKEEVGISIRAQDILGKLEPVCTLTSNYTIVPYITLQKNIPPPKIFATEVECIIDLPLEETLKTFQPDIEHYHYSQEVYKFTFKQVVIWGATARILKQLYDNFVA